MKRSLLAVTAALCVSEGTLRLFMRDPTADLGMPPRGITMADERLGWRFIPRKQTPLEGWGHTVMYAIDGDGNRAPSPDGQSDPAAPTMLFCGESIMAGWGLDWDETIPALLARRTGRQAVNLAVFGYGNHQALRRLEEVLPRFARVSTVVSLFNVLQLERNTRPWERGFALDESGRLVDRAARLGFWSHLRLGLVWRRLPVDQAERIRLAAALLARTAARARAAGAKPLFVVPSYGSPRTLAQHPEAPVFEQLFERQGLRYIVVDVDPRLRQNDPFHPTPAGARVIAVAIAEAL